MVLAVSVTKSDSCSEQSHVTEDDKYVTTGVSRRLSGRSGEHLPCGLHGL